MHNFLHRKSRQASLITIFIISILFVLLIEDLELIWLPLVFGFLFLFLPVNNWLATRNNKNFLHKLTSVQLALNIVFGILLTILVFVVIWKIRFCKPEFIIGDTLTCKPVDERAFVALSDAHELIFNKVLYLGNNSYWFWYYIFISLVVALLIAAYFQTQKLLKKLKL